MTTELLQFLDGSLSADAEAELLHRMSVSPERRNLLRSFINQQALFQRDRNSIAVPYAAEQKLWSRLGEIMPPLVQNAAAPAAIETVIATAPKSGIFNSVFATASVAVICLLTGLGSGFLAGKNSGSENLPLANNSQPANNASGIVESSVVTDNNNNNNNISHKSYKPYKTFETYRTYTNSLQNSGAPQVNEVAPQAADIAVAPAENTPEKAIAPISSMTPPVLAANSIGGNNHFDFYSPIKEEDSPVQKSFLQRWEFQFNQSIGRQYPNSTATNVSFPIVTNSSIGAYYQMFSGSRNFLRNLWAGLNIGSANVTVKKLHVGLENPFDKNSNYIMYGDLVHEQTTYAGILLQYRMPISEKWAIDLGISGNPATAGMMWGGELGFHFDATSNFGIIGGLRGTRLSYKLDPQDQQLLSDGSAKGLKIPWGVADTPPSYNLEFTGGMYFHF